MKRRKILAMLLSILMLLGCFPVSATAPGSEGLSETQETIDSTETVMSGESNGNEEYTTWAQEFVSDTVIGAVSEITELREENVKHFRLDNGTYEAIVYTTPVHRKDKDGVWQDIDNSLVLKGTGTAQSYLTDDLRASFATSFKYNSELFTLNENGYTISIVPIGTDVIATGAIQAIAPQSPLITNATKREQASAFETMEEAAQINNRTSIVYNNIRENTDIEYVLEGNDVKENIIVNAPSDSYEYIFQLNLSGLIAELDEYGNVIISDMETGQAKYIIPAPYMFDSNGEYSYDVYYELQEASSQKYLLCVVADEAWINSETRAFPVTIDPTISSYSSIFDSYTYSGEPTANYGSSTIMWVSNNYTAYVYVDMPNLPSEAIFDEAHLNVYFYYYDVMTSGSLLGGVYPVLTSWNENQITYNNAPTLGSMLGTASFSAAVGAYASSPKSTSFDISEYAKSLYSGEATNYGFAIKRESSTTETNQSVILKASEANDGYGAYISVSYTYDIPDGVYALKNGYGSSYWMTFEGDLINGGTIQHKSSSTSPVSAFEVESLFKISKSGDLYIIRSMVNNNLSFGFSGSEIVTKEIPSADADVSIADKFYIEWDGSGFSIRPYGSSYLITMQNTSTPGLAGTLPANATSKASWQLEKYSGSHKNGYLVRFPSSWGSIGITIGNPGDAKLVAWSTHIDANTLHMQVKSGYEAIADVAWDGTDDIVTITGKSPGKLLIDTQIRHSNDTVVSTCEYYFIIVPDEGTYYIQNVDTGRYIDVEGPSLASGAIIQQWDFHTANQEKWIVEYVENGGGYVRIKSAFSNLYMGVDPSNTTLVKQYASNDYTLWLIDRTSSGNLKLTNKATEGSGKVLAVPLTANENGTDLTQITYTDDTNLRDEWTLFAVGPYRVNLEVVYDQAYNNRYENASSRISEEIAVLQEKYLTEFGITVECSSLTLFSSYADIECSTDPTQRCTHADNDMCQNSGLQEEMFETYHHNNLYNIRARVQRPDVSTCLKVFYTGHDNCMIDTSNGNSIHVTNPYYGLANYGIGIAMIMNFSTYESELKTLIHEFGHFYLVEDHYGISGSTSTDNLNKKYATNIYSRDCIYGEDKEDGDVLLNYTICEGCKSVVRANISRYNH